MTDPLIVIKNYAGEPGATPSSPVAVAPVPSVTNTRGTAFTPPSPTVTVGTDVQPVISLKDP